MLTASELSQRALSALRECATTDRREGMKRYFTSSMDCMGVAVPAVRKIARSLSAEFEGRSKEDYLQFARAIFSSNTMEARQLAFEVLANRPEVMSELSVAELEELGQDNDNWASVDAFSVLLTGSLWGKGLLGDETILGWARSPNVWWRRTAGVSVVPLNLRSRGGRGDPKRTFAVVEQLKEDRHPMVAKAVSWALRSLVPWDPDGVRKFLDENRAELAPLVRREVRNKVDTGIKNPAGRQRRGHYG